MKKAYIAALLAMGLSISAFAADIVPQNQTGVPTDPRFSGSKTCIVGPSTGTTALLCASGSGIILQMIGSDLNSSTEALVLRDATTTTPAVAVTTLAAINGASIAGIFVYPRFYNGLTVTPLSNATNNELWTIIYAQPK